MMNDDGDNTKTEILVVVALGIVFLIVIGVIPLGGGS